MKYEVVLPAEIDERLAAQATASGQDVVHLIQIAVVRFVDDVAPRVNLEWTPQMRSRHSELVDKEIAGTITPNEHLELSDLEQKGNAYYDSVALRRWTKPAPCIRNSCTSVDTNSDPVPFRHPATTTERRHGPIGYSDYGSYRPWLRDEFSYRCAYCLIREQWGRVSGEFDLDHFVPQASDASLTADYENLVYSCYCCNLRKADETVPDPLFTLTSQTVRTHFNGTLVGLTPEANHIIRTLFLTTLPR